MNSVFQDAVKIVSDYLGPAAERFLKRQLDFHLHKTPEEVTAKDMEKISEWVRVSLGLLTQDKKMVDECVERLKNMSSG